MGTKTSQRKPGTSVGPPRRSRQAKASDISGDPVKFRCARRRGGWGRISVEGPGQYNPDRSEGPWGRAGDCSKGGATTQGPAESWASWRRRTKGRCKPSGTEGMPGGGLTEAKREGAI